MCVDVKLEDPQKTVEVLHIPYELVVISHSRAILEVTHRLTYTTIYYDIVASSMFQYLSIK